MRISTGRLTKLVLDAAGHREDDAAGGRPGHLPALPASGARGGDDRRRCGGALQQGAKSSQKVVF